MLSCLKICSFKMDLVFLFMALPSKGEHFSSKLPISSCYEKCPAGYYKEGNCDDPASKYRCRECLNGTFTAIPNTRDKCLRCKSMCGINEVEIKPCVSNSNTVCECKDGYYNAGTHKSFNCLPCQCEACTDSEKSRYDQRKYEACFKEQGLKAAECKRKCATPPDTTAALINTLTIAAGRPNLNTTSPSQSPLPAKDDGRWMVIILVVVLLWLLALCICFGFYLRSAPHWRNIKNPENPPETQPPRRPPNHTVRVCVRKSP
ncbi:tumor necrosis factor receptor superfamily member 1A-like [Hippocampus comes]|uniref:tumor necrosis factor receptor superfamily member 1A-like n=1 Tax=Hippocampus comes TaxID=109280 RepID=UPI00094F1A0C|nr:PREDICTED: tumor necrosis factor receptor superfamily member 1A-like [Hippocampus comes]